MYDPDAPSSQRALAEYRKPWVHERLVEKAKMLTGSEGEAEPLLEDAMMLVLDPERYPWDHLKHPFLKHMGLVMRHVWNGYLRSARVRHEVVTDDVTAEASIVRARGGRGEDDVEKTDEVERFIGAVSREPPADQELHRRRMFHLYRQLGEKLLASLDESQRNHHVARRVFELGAQGVEAIEEQARRIPATYAEVKAAHELLRYHGRRIGAEWDLKEQSRMKDLRERSRKEATAGDAS
jgi:hypothetical protein